jgi:cytochrome c-type biogenesis protein
MLELSLSLFLGLLAFLEPCTIATYSINSARIHKLDDKEQAKNIFQLLFFKSILLMIIFSAVTYLFSEVSTLFIGSVLILFSILFIVGQKVYFHIPHIDLYKLMPHSQKLSQTLKLSLSIPACNIPIIILLSLVLINAHSYPLAIISAIIYTFFYTLPTIYLIVVGFKTKTKELFSNLGTFMPSFTAFIFFIVALYLFSLSYTVDLTFFKEKLEHPTLYALFLGFITGFIFSFNPVSFSSIPMMLAYVVKGKEKNRALILGGSFIAGMLVTHIVLGLVTALGGEWIKGIMGRHWGLVIAPILIFLGIVWSGLIKVKIPWVSANAYKVASVGGAFLLAIPFSIAICPFCTPALLVMLTSSTAIGSPLFGMALLGSFALGRSIPMIIGAFSMSWLEKIRIFSVYQRYFEYLSSIILISVGLYFLNEYFLLVGY